MVIMSKLCKNYSIPDFILDGAKLMLVNKHKYLGVILSCDQKDDLDIRRQIRILYARGNMIIKFFRHCSKEVKCTLFKTYCTNSYCSHLWRFFNSRTLSSCKVAFNRIYRNLLYLNQDTSIFNAMLQDNVNSSRLVVVTL